MGASTRARKAVASTMTRRAPVPPARIVVTATLGLFLAVFALLVFQLRSGRDPALSAGAPLARVAQPPPKRVLVRKLIITRVVVHLPDEAGAAAAPVRVVTSQPSAPAPTFSAPAPAAAPAPAPAPVTTRSS